MSHLMYAKIDGLAGRKTPIELRFDRNLNIIYGLNGSGKTSLLKILHSAMSGNAPILENVPFSAATVEIYSISYKKTFTRHISHDKTIEQLPAIKIAAEIEAQIALAEFVQSHATEQKRLYWRQTPKEEKKPDKLTNWLHRYLPTARLHISDDPFEPFLRSPFTSPSNALTEEILDEYFANSLIRLWKNYSSDVVRAVRDIQAKGLANILDAVLSQTARRSRKIEKIDLNKAYESVRKFLERQGSKLMNSEEFMKRYQKDKALQRVVQDIYRIEQEIDQAMANRLHLQTLIEKLYTGGKHVVFTDDTIRVEDARGQQIGLASLSSGEKHLMRILVETLLARENTILIDEPELSMHVDWQHDLVSNMRLLNPDAQLILATHSPEVMAEIPDNKIIAL